jgi:Cellulase (glycosyl hydrolase family 5)
MAAPTAAMPPQRTPRVPPRAPRASRRAPRRLALVALTSLASLAGALGLASGASAAEAGVNLGPGTPTELAALRTLGTHWVRMFVGWPELEPSRGSYKALWFSAFEKLSGELPAGTKVILDVLGSPAWETGSSDIHTPPANPNDYAAFVAYLAQRLGGRVAAYEIWNEEDEPRFWTGAPNPAAYVQLLRAAYPAIKNAEPNATVVLGGLTGNDYSFLEGVYAAGGKGYFDAVGVHTDTACDVLSPYEFLRGPNNRIVPDSFLAYREVHQTMVANGDEKPIWMTETSWRTTTATCSEGTWAGQKPEGVTPEQQATYLLQAYHCMKEDPYLAVALWFPLQDERGLLNGLMRSNGSRKPSFNAMRSYAQAGDQLTEPCGVFTGPRITVHAPANNVRYNGILPIHVTAASTIGIFRISLKIDGKLIRNFGHHSYPTTLQGDMDWFGAHHIPFGRHTLTFIAYDKQRNVSETSITIIRVRNTGPARRARRASARHHRGRSKHHKR